VSVYALLEVIVVSVSEPLANFVPLQPPPAAQLLAVGEVDQVRTGAKPVVDEVRLAENVMVPAVWAWAREPNRRNRPGNASLSVCMKATNSLVPGAGWLPAVTASVGMQGGRVARIIRTARTHGCRQMQKIRGSQRSAARGLRGSRHTRLSSRLALKNFPVLPGGETRIRRCMRCFPAEFPGRGYRCISRAQE
jgi:hypothetical protein